MTSQLTQMTDFLGGSRVLGRKLKSRLEVVDLVREGLPYASFEAVTRRMTLSLEDACRSLRLPIRTFHRRKQQAQRLDPHESEVIVRLARVMSEATEALGDEEKARRWISKPNRALAGKVPLELLDTDVGAQAVRDELTRIEHGVIS